MEKNRERKHKIEEIKQYSCDFEIKQNKKQPNLNKQTKHTYKQINERTI